MIIGFHINVSFKSMENMGRVIYMHDEKCDANKMNMHVRVLAVASCMCVHESSAKASVGIPGETAKSNGKL